MNGRIGRARELRRIRKERHAEYLAAGIDPNDRNATHAFRMARLQEIADDVQARSKGGHHGN
jgi:hypothetical protein